MLFVCSIGAGAVVVGGVLCGAQCAAVSGKCGENAACSMKGAASSAFCVIMLCSELN